MESIELEHAFLTRTLLFIECIVDWFPCFDVVGCMSLFLWYAVEVVNGGWASCRKVDLRYILGGGRGIMSVEGVCNGSCV